MYCKAGKINCKRYVTLPAFEGSAEVQCNFTLGRYLDVTTFPFECCPFESIKEPIEEKIVLELTKEEAYWLFAYFQSEYPNAFGFSHPTSQLLKVYSQGSVSVATKINVIKNGWDKEHK